MKTCKDCIHVNVCRYICSEDVICCKFFKDRSKFIEQKHGFFLEDEDCYGKTVYQCSNCGMYFSLIEGTPEENEYDYCPSCGAKMDELEQALKERKNEKEL